MKKLTRTVPDTLFPLAPITVLIGHYGVGKTNLSLNLAIDAARNGQKPTLIDLDLVNPYFRSGDYRDLLSREGIESIVPIFSGTTLDVPSISGEIDVALGRANNQTPLIIDAGGDEVGATALGRFSQSISDSSSEVYYVINKYRNLTQTDEEAQEVLLRIEEKTKLKATGIINNSHLQEETTISAVEDSLDFAESCAQILQIPLICTTVPSDTMKELCRDIRETGSAPKSSGNLSMLASQTTYCVQVYVHTPWEQ